MTVQVTIQLSIVEQKSRDDFEAQQNVEKVRENLVAEEIEKMVEGTKNVDTDEFVNYILNSQNDPVIRLDPGSYKESPEVEITVVVQLVNVIEEEDESAEDDYELRRRIMQESLPSMIDSHVNEATKTTVPMEDENLLADTQDQVEGPIANNTSCRSSANRPRDQDDHYDDSHPEGENSAKRQKISEHGTYVIGESSFGQADKSDPSPSTSSNQEQLDDFDFWTDKYDTDDDELPAEIVSQELVKEMSETVDEAKLRKVVGEMMRQRCTLRDEHQYHIDQMQNFLKNDIVWESRK
ncbi:hypothetical protein Tco_1519336, partial [Tanacetum coccineum]